MFQQDVIHWMLYEVKYLPAALRPGWRLPAESAPNICRIETQRWRYSSAIQTEMNLMTQKACITSHRKVFCAFIYSYSNIFILIVIRGLRCTIINNKSVNVFVNLQKERCLDSMSRQTFSTHISPQGAVDSAESDWFSYWRSVEFSPTSCAEGCVCIFTLLAFYWLELEELSTTSPKLRPALTPSQNPDQDHNL